MPKKAELRAKLSLDNSSFRRGVKEAKKMAVELGRSVATATADVAKRGMQVLEVAALAGAAALALGVKHAYDLGGQLSDLSSRTGIAAGQLMILQQAAKDNGIEDISGAIKKMQVNLVEAVNRGTGPAAAALQMLGLSAEQLQKQAPAAQFRAIGEAINSIKDPATRTAEAVAIFGKQGADLLTLFGDTQPLETAAKSIGKQAQILDQYAGRFDNVSDKFGRAGLKFQGFFVGVAEKALPVVEKIMAEFDSLDLAEQGEKFADGMREAANYITGAFHDPEKFAGSMVDFLKAGFLEATGLMAQRLEKNIINFWADFVDYGDTALSSVEALVKYSFQTGVEFGSELMQKEFGESIAQISIWLVETFRKAASFLGKAIDSAIHLNFDFSKMGEQAAAAIFSAINIASSGQHKSFSQFLSESKGGTLANAANQMRGFANGVKNPFEGAAKEFLDSAKQASKEIASAGKKFVDEFYGPEAPSPVKEMNYQMTNFRSLNGGLSTGSLSSGRLSSGGLYGGGYNQTPLIAARERHESENYLVAQGLASRDSRRSTRAGYSVVRAGDHARARNAARDKERENIKNQAANAAATANNTAEIAELLGGKGTTGSGS